MNNCFAATRAFRYFCTSQRRTSTLSKHTKQSQRIPPSTSGRSSRASNPQSTRGLSPQVESTSNSDETPPRADWHSSIKWLVLIPVLGVALLHSPYEVDFVTGGSMSPFFNPNFDPERDLPNARRDWILVRRCHGWDGFPDPNEAKKARRKSSGGEVPENATQSREFQRGQIVLFNGPHSPNTVGVKRIVGIPGDRVQPLPGYADGEASVTIPWNHLWVEGDADSRDKSLDSNWYGPISQNLVVGEAIALLSPWWNPTWIDWKHHTWPARSKERVGEGVVAEAGNDPQAVERMKAWSDGQNQKRLEAMRNQPEAHVEHFAKYQSVRKQVREYYRSAALLIAKDDPSSERWQLAQATVKQMELLYGRDVLRQGMIKRSLANQAVSMEGKSASAGKQAALQAESQLRKQGWTVERNSDGTVRVI